VPARRIHANGREWRVYPSGFVTQYAGDEFGLIFVADDGGHREVRVTRYAPMGVRSREQSLAELSDEALRALFVTSQPSARSPEAGYRE
jgi:hypothetical protein